MGKSSVFIAIISLIFVACKKEPSPTLPPDPVDAVIGTYYGLVHLIEDESSSPRTSPGFHKYLDTTYQTTVTIKKVASDSFLVVTDIPLFEPTYSPTLYNLSTNYKRQWSELSFNSDSSLTLNVNHQHSYSSGASGFFSYSLVGDFTGKR